MIDCYDKWFHDNATVHYAQKKVGARAHIMYYFSNILPINNIPFIFDDVKNQYSTIFLYACGTLKWTL